jgi:hypothetical protein
MAKTLTKTKNRSMSERERDELTAQIETERAFKAGLGKELPENGGFGVLNDADGKGVDAGRVDARIARINRALKAGEVSPLKGADRNAALSRYKHLEGYLPEVLLTEREMDLFPRDGHDYQAAVRKTLKSEVGNTKTQQLVEEYRTLGRSLHPGDAEKASVERLRKKR